MRRLRVAGRDIAGPDLAAALCTLLLLATVLSLHLLSHAVHAR